MQGKILVLMRLVKWILR